MRTVAAAVALALSLAVSGAAAQDAPPVTFETCNPQTLDAAVSCLKQTLPEDVQREVLAMPIRDFVARSHHGLGQAIRNTWGLWGDGPLFRHMQGLGFTHPDDMSTVILNSFWLDGHNCPRKVEQQAAYYKAWWKAQNKTMQNVRPNASGITVMPPPPNIPRPQLDCTQGSRG